MNRRQFFDLFKNSFKNLLTDNDPLRAAALTFFIILPLPSILLIVEAVFAFFFGQAQASQLLIQQITSLAGPEVGNLFGQLLSSSMSPFQSVWGAITVVGFSLGGAVGTFAVLRDTMDVIWGVSVKKKQSFPSLIRHRIGPFVVVSGLGLIVIAWTAGAVALLKAITHYSPNEMTTLVTITIAQVISSFILSLMLFALTYKLIPDPKVHWRDVGLPSAVAALAFTVTNYVFGTYVATFTVTTVIGAAGSLLIILLWIFIITQIMLFGAEMTKAIAVTPGEHVREHWSVATERFVKSIERAGERIEEAAKGEVESQPPVAVEGVTTKKASGETAPKSEEKASEKSYDAQKMSEAKELQDSSSQVDKTTPKAEETQSESKENSSEEDSGLEVRLIIKSSRKKKKNQNETSST